MMKNGEFVKEINIRGMWPGIDVEWKNVNPDVNLIVGINGSGKTTLLHLLNAYLNSNSKEGSKVDVVPSRNFLCDATYIRTFDTPAIDKKKSQSWLTQELYSVINQNDKRSSFFNYRLRMLDELDKVGQMQKRIEDLFATVNEFFAETGKTIQINSNPSKLVFKLADGTAIDVESLSSGEKEILLLLINIFLQEEKPAITLLDEPELSLHISWQNKLIECIRKLNPNCQLIIATHSPSLLSKGWGDKVVYMEDIVKRR